MSPRQQADLATLHTQARWFAGYFQRAAERIIAPPANDEAANKPRR